MGTVPVHVPILVQPIVEQLLEPFRRLPESAPPHLLIDCTFGGGGHTEALLSALAGDPKLRKHRVLSIDQDASAIESGQKRFAREIEEGHLRLVHARFGEFLEELQPEGEFDKIFGIMADLGFSSDQLESAERGLSFLREGPLDMRLDPSRGESAYEYLRKVSERELERVLLELGEERFSKRIASAIVQARRERQLPDTTTGLAALILRSVPPPARHGRIHAATRTFQALRIQVNDELKELDRLLARAMILLKPGGRLAILSFHSLEDRRVKLAFRGDPFRALTKKPIEPSEDEIRANPRARSAKLRLGERV